MSGLQRRLYLNSKRRLICTRHWIYSCAINDRFVFKVVDDLKNFDSKLNTAEKLSKMNSVSWGLSGTTPINPLLVYSTNGSDLPLEDVTMILESPAEIPWLNHNTASHETSGLIKFPALNSHSFEKASDLTDILLPAPVKLISLFPKIVHCGSDTTSASDLIRY